MRAAEPPEDEARRQREALQRTVAAAQERRERSQAEKLRTVWFGLGTFGLVGWSVAIPTVLGAAAGVWLDRHVPSRHSWTLTLLLAGLVLGCWNAWQWIEREDRRGK